MAGNHHAVTAQEWFDPICPWAYLGTVTSRIVTGIGVHVTLAPFELHPELSDQPTPIRVGGRLDQLHRRIEPMAEQLGLDFRPPTSTSSTRLALAAFAVVARDQPELAEVTRHSLFRLRFVEDRSLSNRAELTDALDRVGLDGASVMERADDHRLAIDTATAAARELGVDATPSWRFSTGFLLTGVHEPEQVRRWITRMTERASTVGQ